LGLSQDSKEKDSSEKKCANGKRMVHRCLCQTLASSRWSIHILQGQSGEVLPEVLKNIDKPCLFWLDAHYSGGSTAKGQENTPVIQELECILNHKNANEHIILIDDARLFIDEDDYPALKTLERLVLENRHGWTFQIKDDIIRAHRRSRLRV